MRTPSNYIQQSPWEADGFSAVPKIPHFLWHPKVNNHVHKSPSLNLILRLLNPVHSSHNATNSHQKQMNCLLLCVADSPGFLHMTHTAVRILSIVSEAGNPGICSESDPDVEDTVVCGDAVLWLVVALLPCTEDNESFSSWQSSAFRLRVSWRVGGGTPDVR